MKKLIKNTLLVIALLGAAACKKGPDPAPVTPPPVVPPVVPGASINYLQQAKETHTFTVNNLLTASYGYRANTTSKSNNCFEWYNVSQIYADA
ncbi:MAG: hypothetical protein EOO45_16790, partial [Flavobacterium sp.]